MTANKKIDYKKKFETCKKKRDEENKAYQKYRQVLNKTYQEHRQALMNDMRALQEKLNDKEKGYTIKIKEQTVTCKSLNVVREIVKSLTDLGFWYFTVGEKE